MIILKIPLDLFPATNATRTHTRKTLKKNKPEDVPEK